MIDADEAKVIKLTPKLLNDPDVSPEIWVDRYAKLHGINYCYKTNAVRDQGEIIEPGLFISKMRLYCHDLDLGGIKKMLGDAFIVWRRQQARHYLNQLKGELSYQVSGADLVGNWVEAATGERRKLDIAVMRHFCWQVKRKLFGLPVEHHIMVVAVGKSGGGKSVAVHKLLSPLSEVTALRDLTVFKDQFSRRGFTRSYVMFFDELARSEETDMNALKNIVTASSVDWRAIGSEATHSAPQNCTFIGCSNSPLRERIKDPTSSRRFWELNCAEKLSWDLINSMDYLSLWRSIDENGPCPILTHLDAIRSVQEREIAYKDMIECWLESNCEAHPFNSESPTTNDLYSAFSDWARMQCIFDLDGFQTFARGLQLRVDNLQWGATSKHSNRGTVWSLRLKQGEPEPCHRPIGLGAAFSEGEAVSAPLADPTEVTEK